MTNDKKTRKRRTHLEDHPDVQKWCTDFVIRVEDELGITPTQEQATQAFLVAALRAIGRDDA